MEHYFEGSARLRLFRPEVIIGTIGQPRLDRLVREIPGDMAFLQELLDEATIEKKPKVVS